MTTKPATLGELRKLPAYAPGAARRTVKEELRTNLLKKLEAGEPLFAGIHGYEDTVLPQIANAILGRHNFILLGLRGQAKSRILRGLVDFLDLEIPYIAGCQIHDNPLAPLCRSCRDLIADSGDAAPIAWLPRDARFVEKLATPDVTIADILGDVDPIKAARSGRDLGDELTIHYGLLPRANRGIFAVNELPDLAGKIQVGLFNIMQEGDIQIKGYPVRMPLDVLLVFTANPEDYTARGKIITPLKDRIGSEIRTHYPGTLEEGIAITAQEAWQQRKADKVVIPRFVREIIERIAFVARDDKKIDKRSGVSQRLPISCMENVLSNAERRALVNRETVVVPRVSDIYSAMPAITGKLELEYEGEMKGGDVVARELIRAAIAKTFDVYFADADLAQIVQWFDLGGEIKLTDTASASDAIAGLKKIQGLVERLTPLGLGAKEPVELQVSSAEFVLEGLHAHKRIGRSEERVFSAGEKPRKQEPVVSREDFPERGRGRRSFN